MPNSLPFAGWRIRYWTSVPTPGLPWRCGAALRSVMPGAEVIVEVDPDADAMSITPPEGLDRQAIAEARELAAGVVERAHRAGLL